MLKLSKDYTSITKKEWKANPGHDVVLAIHHSKDGKVVVAVLKSSEKTTTLAANEKIELNAECASPANRC